MNDVFRPERALITAKILTLEIACALYEPHALIFHRDSLAVRSSWTSCARIHCKETTIVMTITVSFNFKRERVDRHALSGTESRFNEV